MSVTADSVIVDLVANNGQYDAAVRGSAANFELSAQRTVRAAGEFERANRLSLNATRNLGRQIADVGTQVAGGQSPFLILAQQAPQVADALADTAGKAASVARFFAGPWGAALLAAGSVVAVLASKVNDAGDAAEDATPKLTRLQEVLAGIAGISTKQVEIRIQMADIDSQLARINRARGSGDSRVETAVINDEVKALKARRSELEASYRLEELANTFQKQEQDRQDAAREAKSKADAAARKAETEAKQRQEELRENVVKLEKAFDPLAASAREYYGVLKDIADLEKTGLISSSTAEVYRNGAEIARRAAAMKADGLDRPSINDILNRPGGISSQVAADDKRISDDFEREQAARKAQVDTEAYLQRQRERNVRSLADLYRSAFEGGAKGIGEALKDALLDAVATALARQTIGAFAGLLGGGGGGIGGSIVKSVFGRASGGYAAPRSLHRVNETAGGVELLRMGPTGGQVIPLGKANASQRGGSTTVLQTIEVDARGAVMNDEFARLILSQADQNARQITAVGSKAAYEASPERLQRQNLLGS